MNILEAKRIESQNLREVTKEFSQLFRTGTFADDQKFLEQYGISIPDKKNLPNGYIKLWPQDFIVEEIALSGEVQTIYQDKFLSKKKDFFFEEPVIGATLVKCGLSTLEAVEELAKDLRIEKEKIKYAGIKDKHAITSQLISIKGGDAEKLHDLSLPYLFVKNTFSEKRELFIGGLQGNQFTILIRTEYTLPEKEFSLRLKKVQEDGFYNFYYLQRFGIPRLKSPLAGLELLRGDYERSVFTELCQSGQRELPYFQALRNSIAQLWGNWEEISGILDSFPLTFQVERKMIDYLIGRPEDFLGALKEIPEQIRLWTDSFITLLFNKKLSFYLREKKDVPNNLPFFLSRNQKTWDLYKDFLKEYGLFSMPLVLKNLSPFPFLNIRGKEKETKIFPQILDYKIIPEGVILSFNLPKGCYATTFLSHLFNLVSGTLPSKMSNLAIDTKANLKKPSLEEILNQFQEVVYLPSWKYSWRL